MNFRRFRTDKISAVEQITAQLGRPLRVLHIGNIANNAYNNAKIQRRYGIEADVICYDYYHIMSCPEWEDAQFDGDVGDHNYPDWHATRSRGWKRPDWFVQGTADVCLQYLRARIQGLHLVARLLLVYLEASYWQMLASQAADRGEVRRPIPLRLRAAISLVEALGLHVPADHGDRKRVHDLQQEDKSVQIAPVSIHERTEQPPVSDTATDFALRSDGDQGTLDGRVVLAPVAATGDSTGRWYCPRLRDLVAQTIWLARTAFDMRWAIRHAVFDFLITRRLQCPKHRSVSLWLWTMSRRLVGRRPPTEADILSLISRPQEDIKPALVRRMMFLIASTVDLLKSLITAARGYWKVLIENTRRHLTLVSATARGRMASLQPPEAWEKRFAVFTERRARLFDLARTCDDRTRSDIQSYVDSSVLRFFDVVSHYDIVQGYSIDGFIPYMNGLKNFASYEHGTIRDLPWEPSLFGVICNQVYRESPLVFVTNSDVLPSVKRLGLRPEVVVHLPHAFDDAKLRRFRQRNPKLTPPPGPPVFFSPSRHHWKGGRLLSKGNDVFLKAAAILMAEGHEFRIILVEWGEQVKESRLLIGDLGLTDRVAWVPPMKKRELWAAYCRAHAVVDQFSLPALGGVGFEAMALGRRLVTAIDEAQLAEFFGKVPPCFVAMTVESCVDRLREIVADPNDRAGRGAAAQAWIEDYHSADRIVTLQAEAYRRCFRFGRRTEATFDAPMLANDSLEGHRSAPDQAEVFEQANLVPLGR